MELKKNAQAGSLESSDIMILIEPLPDNGGRVIEIDSSVFLQFGDNIRQIIESVLNKFNINNIHLIAKDKGALPATIEARVETALHRAAGTAVGILL